MLRAPYLLTHVWCVVWVSVAQKNLPVSVSWLPGSTATEIWKANSFAEDLNCSLGAGASYAPPDHPTPVTLAECFSLCQQDPQCDAVRVDWFAIARNNFTQSRIGCGLRGGVTDRTKCAIQAPVFARPHTVRYGFFAVDAPMKSQLVIAVTALSGYLPLVRNSGNDWTTSAAPYPGETGDLLPRLLVAMRGEPSLALPSLRMQIPTAHTAHLGVLRYDALGSGQAALAVVNLAAAPQHGSLAVAQLDLRAMPPQLLGQRPRNLLCPGACPQAPALSNRTALSVAGLGVSAFAGLQLPRWQPRGHLYNCSAAYIGMFTTAPMPLAACLVACLRDARCDAVTVEWLTTHAWPRPAAMPWRGNTVACQLLGGLRISSCARDDTELPSHSTVTIVHS
jgi:hypothetical protein